jgi:hypothetical protein
MLEKIMKKFKILLSVSALSILMACGSGSDDTNPSRTGVFLDSPVINIGYRTETLEGVTNSQGEYEYLAGETVTFFIGDLEFPTVAAKGTVTPLDLAETEEVNDPVVVNMIRLLQTLDQDGNPDNGITITDDAKGAATQVDFDLSEADFAASVAVTELIVNAGQDLQPTELVSKEDALEHFNQQLDSANSFTEEFFNGRTFNVNDTDTDLLTLAFTAGGTGTMKFDATEDNNFDENDTKTITWEINANGSLTFHELSSQDESSNNDYWDWTLTPTSINTANYSALIILSIVGIDEGQPVSFSESAELD